MRECLFCNLPDERIIDQCDHTLTVRDGFPVSPGHTIVISRRHTYTFIAINYMVATPEVLRVCYFVVSDDVYWSDLSI